MHYIVSRQTVFRARQYTCHTYVWLINLGHTHRNQSSITYSRKGQNAYNTTVLYYYLISWQGRRKECLFAGMWNSYERGAKTFPFHMKIVILLIFILFSLLRWFCQPTINYTWPQCQKLDDNFIQWCGTNMCYRAKTLVPDVCAVQRYMKKTHF